MPVYDYSFSGKFIHQLHHNGVSRFGLNSRFRKPLIDGYQNTFYTVWRPQQVIHLPFIVPTPAKRSFHKG